jgi:hypothetical protein
MEMHVITKFTNLHVYSSFPYTHTNSTIAVDIKKNPEKRQQSIDCDFCKLSSSCDVVYKERWHQNRNNSTVFEDLLVSIVDLTVANIRFTSSTSSRQ